KKRIDAPVKLVIGEPIGRERLDPLASDPKAMMDFLRKSTYELSPKPLRTDEYGFEFEERHRA
ncbi:MAG: acyltransferase, partial [Pseudomonadota bacterium]